MTTLVKRWSLQINTLHMPVGEMTTTLQDVGMILEIYINGQALIGLTIIGEERK